MTQMSITNIKNCQNYFVTTEFVASFDGAGLGISVENGLTRFVGTQLIAFPAAF